LEDVVKHCRFTPFRWLVSLALAGFYLHLLPGSPAKLNPAFDWVNPTFDFLATAYCVPGVTASGEMVAPGMVAADPRVLPFGSIIQIETDLYRGIYRVTDTGPLIKGKRLDVYIPGWSRAVEFGRKAVKVTVLQYGNPR
jgi:3D (Asp-Asp-Asp) domain-containing protein